MLPVLLCARSKRRRRLLSKEMASGLLGCVLSLKVVSASLQLVKNADAVLAGALGMGKRRTASASLGASGYAILPTNCVWRFRTHQEACRLQEKVCAVSGQSLPSLATVLSMQYFETTREQVNCR